MSAATPAQHPKKNPAAREGTGGVIQLGLDGIEPAPPIAYFTPRKYNSDPILLIKAIDALLSGETIPCAQGTELGIGTHIPNQVSELRNRYRINIKNAKLSKGARAEQYVLMPSDRHAIKNVRALRAGA